MSVIYLNEASLIIMFVHIFVYGALSLWFLYLAYGWIKIFLTDVTSPDVNIQKYNFQVSNHAKKSGVFAVVLILGFIFSSYFWSYGPKLVNVTPIPVRPIDRELLDQKVKDLTPKKNNPIEELERLRRSTDGLVE